MRDSSLFRNIGLAVLTCVACSEIEKSSPDAADPGTDVPVTELATDIGADPELSQDVEAQADESTVDEGIEPVDLIEIADVEEVSAPSDVLDTPDTEVKGPPFLGIAAGSSHTCAIFPDGSVKCWGENEYGQLGDGMTSDRASPTQVVGLTADVKAIAAGDYHSCAIVAGGSVKCWGRNDYGQRGDGTTGNQGVPTEVKDLGGNAIDIEGGRWHTCAVLSGGGVKCWGLNREGQLGDGTNENRDSPTQVQGLTNGVVGIEAGGVHTCALLEGGGVKCWGDNYYGELGDGSNSARNTPVQVLGLTSGARSVALGHRHSCAVVSDGSVKCWGLNETGQLGDGTWDHKNVPTPVTGLSNDVVAIAAAELNTCAVLSGGGVKCWGDNRFGQLADETTTTRNTPVQVFGLEYDSVSITVGLSHSCAILSDSVVRCWGDNSVGQLGSGSTDCQIVPARIPDLTGSAIAIEAGWRHTCALFEGGSLRCWGFNMNGQIGDGTTTDRASPTPVSELSSGVVAVESGGSHSCALLEGGGVKCWGRNEFGQVGDWTTTDKIAPAQVNGLGSGVDSIAVGGAHTCALIDTGDVRCWGYNNSGQLGDGTSTPSSKPVNTSGLAGVVGIAAGQEHSCAIVGAGGGIKCWGRNSVGALGIGTGDQDVHAIPADVPDLAAGVKDMSLGYYHSCALLSTGGVKCWGENDHGEVGDGTTGRRPDLYNPTDVSGLGAGVVAIDAGSSHNCALLEGGSLKCWGYNVSGQVGDGTTDNRNAPTQVLGLTAGVKAVAAGGNHTCAILADGGIACWGNGYFGQLGNGIARRKIPVDVVW